MITKGSKLFEKSCLKLGLIILCVSIFLAAGCATSAKEFDPNITGPQMIVEPDTIRLGIAKLTKGTQILFKGKGFQPEDSVFVSLIDVKKGDQMVDVPVADGEVDKNGYFTAKVGTLAKVNELLRAEIGSNEKNENVIVITQDPIPEGVYTARAISMESDKKAECQLRIKGPSVWNSVIDWLGKVTGKIRKEK
jgi:hypothetical protein